MKSKTNREEQKKKMLNEYLNLQPQYIEYTDYIQNKIKNMLTENDIKYQTITSRVKSYKSLEKKLTENIMDVLHNNIMMLNDLSGVRIIFYEERELNKFFELIKQEFNSSIKIKHSDDISRYDGINITISIPNIKKFKQMLCEIQLTTVISHAMNEFGHDIIYKDENELENKNKKEYEVIRKIFNEARNDSLEILAKFEMLSKRIETIKSGSKTLQKVMNFDYVSRIKEIDDFDSLENIINDLIEIIPFVNEDEEAINKLIDSKIINAIVEKFITLPEEKAKWLSYDTFEYKFNKLFEFLLRYMYLWKNQFKNIIEMLSTKIKESNRPYITESFNRFIKDCLSNDKINGNRKKSNFEINQIAYNYIMDDSTDSNCLIKMVIASGFCDMRCTYTERVEEDKYNVVYTTLSPNEMYVQKIENVLNKCCNIFLNNQDYKIFEYLIGMVNGIDEKLSIKMETIVYDFFYNHYDEIDEYFKNKLYSQRGAYKSNTALKHKFFIKLKEDKFYKLFSYVFSYFVEDLIHLKYNERDELRLKYLDEYIKSFSENNIEEIKKLCLMLKKHKTQINNYYFISDFFINLGKTTELAEKLYKDTKNKYLLIGIIEKNTDYKYELKAKEDIIEILECLLNSKKHNISILDKVLKEIELIDDLELDILFARIIFRKIELFKNKKYREYVIGKIEKNNLNKTAFLENIYFRPEVEQYIVDEINQSELKIILNNYLYCNLTYFNEILIKLVFEKRPKIVRELIIQMVKENPKREYYNQGLSLDEAKNYKDELKNNLLLCIELLKNNYWFNIKHHVKYLIGKYSDDVEKQLLEILKEKPKREIGYHILEICELLDVSINAWPVFEKIIEIVEEDDKEIYSCINSRMFNTGAVWGEYGIAEAFKEKMIFFECLNPKNSKVKKYVNLQKKYFKSLYTNEKNDTDKEIISRKVNYEYEKELVSKY